MNRFFRLVILGAVLLAVACGGGGGGGGSGGGGGGGGGSGPSYTATYTEPANNAPGNVVLKLNAQGATLVFDVVVYGSLTDAYGIAFHLQYDPAIFNYLSASEGTVFDDAVCSGSCTEFQVNSTDVSDKIIVGLARTSPGAGVNLPSGVNVAMTLRFTPKAAGGPTAFDFVAGTRELEDTGGTDLSTGWFEGTATVT